MLECLPRQHEYLVKGTNCQKNLAQYDLLIQLSLLAVGLVQS